MEISNSVNSYLDRDFLSMINSRRERLDSLLNQTVNNDNSADKSPERPEKTEKSETSFERLVKNIKNSDLTIGEKKAQIHYAKYALMQMDEEQSKTFEKNIKTLIVLKKKNQSGQYDAVITSTGRNYSPEIEKALKKLNELKEQISDEKESSQIKTLRESSEQIFFETIKTSGNSYSSTVIDEYVEKLNKNYETLFPNVKSNIASVDVVA